MKFHVLTLFPEMIEQGLAPSILGRATEKELITLKALNIRDFSEEKHKKVDDYPYGGGAGMLMQAQPVYDAWKSLCVDRKIRTVYLTPQGTPFTQSMAQEMAKEEEIIFLCGHYEGIDQRVLEEIVTDYVSIGDYVLTGGELPSMVMIDAIARLVPGVLGNDTSAEEESFDNDLLEYPQYTRPEIWHGKKVPEVLLSGNHRLITKWRRERQEEKTAAVRPDLYAKYAGKQALIKRLSKDKRNTIHMMESLARGRSDILYDSEGEVLLYDKRAKTVTFVGKEAGLTQSAIDKIPCDALLFVVSDEKARDILLEHGFIMYNTCRQFLYTAKEPLPVKYKNIKALTQADLAYTAAHYELDTESYLLDRIRAGCMYGAFDGDRLIAFMGMHSEGSIGLLYVDEAYRRQGIAESLEAFVINRCLEKGYIPYGHVEIENEASRKLQEKLGLYEASKTVYWLGKTADN